MIIERSASGGAGYAIGLYPLGSSVLHGLGAYEHLADRALPLERYVVADGTGHELRRFNASLLTGGVGPILMVDRGDLIDVLESCCEPAELRRAVTMRSLDQHHEGVDVAFDDGSAERFDLVVGCDGADSATRTSVFGPMTGYDSGWDIWTWWAGADDAAVAREWWGAGCLFGVYPIPGRVMCCAGAPRWAIDRDHVDVRSALQRRFRTMIEHVPSIGDRIAGLDDPYRWPMRDVRSTTWVRGHVALCGDSAVSVMPTAGVGASNAMRAAANLADELSRADPGSVARAIGLFERRCRSIVERHQTESRRLAHAMFVTQLPLARLRDELVRRIPTSRVMGPVLASMQQPF